MTKVHRQLLKRLDTVRRRLLGHRLRIPGQRAPDDREDPRVLRDVTATRHQAPALHRPTRTPLRSNARRFAKTSAPPTTSSRDPVAPVTPCTSGRRSASKRTFAGHSSPAASSASPRPPHSRWVHSRSRSTRSTRWAPKAHWLHGLDVLSMAGIRGAVIPHYDNAEGGNYDTRYCYLGEERLVELEHQLPDDTGILGVDEHTAAHHRPGGPDPERPRQGGVYWRRNGSTRTFASGETVELAEIQSFTPEPSSAPATLSTMRTTSTHSSILPDRVDPKQSTPSRRSRVERPPAAPGTSTPQICSRDSWRCD